MQRKHIFLLLVLLLIAFALIVSVSASDCTITGADWCHQASAGSTSSPTGLTSLGLPYTWVIDQSGLLLTLNSSTGSVVLTTLVGTVTKPPMPILFSSGRQAVFVSGNDGYVYRINSSTGACVWKTYLGRTNDSDITPGCGGAVTEICQNDAAEGTPAVRFGTDEGDSLIYAGTSYDNGCGISNSNRVYALNAVTGESVWVFNKPSGGGFGDGSSPYAIGAVKSGVNPDVWDDFCGEPGIRDNIYVGSIKISQSSNPTLWALDAVSGNLKWSLGNVGSIETVPSLSYNPALCERLYVGTTSREIVSVGITSAACGGPAPCKLWSYNAGQQITKDISVPYAGPLAGKIIYPAGNSIYVIQDNGGSATAVCTYGPGRGAPSAVKTRPFILYGSGKGYLGLQDGSVAQVDMTTCTHTASRMIESGVAVGDAFIDYDLSTGYFLIATNDAGKIVRFGIPASGW